MDPKLAIGSVAPFGLRLPPALRERVEMQARHNRRSMNSEIIVLLEHALPRDETKAATEAGTSIAAE